MSSSVDNEPDFAIRSAFRNKLRSQMKQVRGALSPQAREDCARRMAGHVLALKAFRQRKRLVSYLALGDEADTAFLHEACGGPILIPRIHEKEAPLRFHHWNPDELREGPFGLWEPMAETPSFSLEEGDFVLVPALAIDTEGHRLGYGKGYYDRTFTACGEGVRKGLTLCAFIFDFQRVIEIPAAPWDVPVDLIVTEQEVSYVNSENGNE